ncbi:BrnT family toxin [Boseaceae bacterium BT-24-1]|nr:BrnT family toxin [Boseaceae bacterium BT-24-1]
MKIVWDEPKRISNLAKHGQDFAALDEGFFAEAAILPAKQGRWLAIGRLADGSIAVVFATLGTEAISIVSMRRANRAERRLLE